LGDLKFGLWGDRLKTFIFGSSFRRDSFYSNWNFWFRYDHRFLWLGDMRWQNANPEARLKFLLLLLLDNYIGRTLWRQNSSRTRQYINHHRPFLFLRNRYNFPHLLPSPRPSRVHRTHIHSEFLRRGQILRKLGRLPLTSLSDTILFLVHFRLSGEV